jgi:hypothetical protein
VHGFCVIARNDLSFIVNRGTFKLNQSRTCTTSAWSNQHQITLRLYDRYYLAVIYYCMPSTLSQVHHLLIKRLLITSAISSNLRKNLIHVMRLSFRPWQPPQQQFKHAKHLGRHPRWTAELISLFNSKILSTSSKSSTHYLNNTTCFGQGPSSGMRARVLYRLGSE